MSLQLTPTFWLVNDGIGDSPIHSLLNHIHKQVIHNSSLSVPQKLLSWKTKCYTCLYMYVLVYCKYEHEDIHLGHMYVIKGLFYILKRKPFLFTGLCQFKWIQSTAEKKSQINQKD